MGRRRRMKSRIDGGKIPDGFPLNVRHIDGTRRLLKKGWKGFGYLYILRARSSFERAFLDSVQSSEGLQISLGPVLLSDDK
jgi:hypothetical protein